VNREKSLVAHDSIPEISLRRVQALWVLIELGFRTGGSDSTFLEYIKSLRRFGIPFSPEEISEGRRHRNAYHYEHLMELAVALSFRLHRILPWDVIDVLVRYRAKLRSIYRLAYLNRESGVGQLVQIKVGALHQFTAKGIFLDLNFRYVDDQLVSSGGPRAINASEAVRLYIQQVPGSQIRPPLPLSRLAKQIVRFASVVPVAQQIPKAFNYRE
jgi:hypothetical protein